MNFRDQQKKHHSNNAQAIFGQAAGMMDGDYNGQPRAFCLPDDMTDHNLHESLRAAAIEYFQDRNIPWHDGFPRKNPPGTHAPLHVLPSNHVCCSQSQCVNTFFLYRNAPDNLGDLLRLAGYDVAECLPILSDNGDSHSFVAFEWIGLHNYLGEHSYGRVAKCWERTRGAGFTSADFTVRFRDTSNRLHLVLGEWKYSEEYRRELSRVPLKTDITRLGIYEPLIRSHKWRFPKSLTAKDLLFEPFYQLMRLQLLALVMEASRTSSGTGEMDAEIVSVLHVSPKDNQELRGTITSPVLQNAGLGNTIYDAWNAIAPKDRFSHMDSDDLIGWATSSALPLGTRDWADWMRRRYPVNL